MLSMKQIPTLAGLLKQAIDNRLLDVHTALIGRVEKYDASTQLADVQPLMKHARKTNGDGIKQEGLPLLVDVPVLFPRAGGFFISLPIQVGDFVQVIFNENSIDDFLTESASKIDSAGRFTLQGAVAIPGIYPLSKPVAGAHKANLVMGKDKGVQLHIDGEKIRLGSDVADEALALAKNVTRELEKFRGAFNSHTHIAAATVGAVTNAPTTTQITPTGDIATKKVVAL
jgi:hypothetical protein